MILSKDNILQRLPRYFSSMELNLSILRSHWRMQQTLCTEKMPGFI